MISVDGTRGGFQLMLDGWLQADVECNPLLGPQVMDLGLKLMNGQEIPKEALTDEQTYYAVITSYSIHYTKLYETKNTARCMDGSL